MKIKIGIIIIFAALSYVLGVVLGEFLKPNYNFIYNSISELSQVGTDRIFIVELLFGLYNIGLLIYTILMFIVYKDKLNKKKIAIFISLLICSLSGFIMAIFPQEARDAELTTLGKMHIIGAGIAAITTMFATIMSWISYRKDQLTKNYAIYSLVTFIVIFLSGLSSPILISLGIDNILGLIERITIGAFMIWMLVTGLLQYKGKILV